MGSSQTLGGERLGSGNKNKVYLHGYERSTHDLSTTWRSTMSAGTLVPFFTKIALPADTWDIDVNCNVLTHPTIGPLFGSYKVQIDFFQIPIRLYQGLLYQNKLDIGMNMAKVMLPQIEMEAPSNVDANDLDNSQINPSSIFNHLNIRGLGMSETGIAKRDFNATAWLSYWEIVKNYYSNKQEEVGAVIHNSLNWVDAENITATLKTGTLQSDDVTLIANLQDITEISINILTGYLQIDAETVGTDTIDGNTMQIWLSTNGDNSTGEWIEINKIFDNFIIDEQTQEIKFYNMNINYWNNLNFQTSIATWWIGGIRSAPPKNLNEIEPKVKMFPLVNIDNMRERIMKESTLGAAYKINKDNTKEPYSLALKTTTIDDETYYSQLSNQEGLALKTYQSDLFNNWISTEWIDGSNGINEITKINITNDSFTLDELNINKKVYDMLNRIAVSGGTYYDWLDATYDHTAIKAVQNPVYIGGLSKELTFQEVVSTAESTSEQPLGTLAGRGVMTNKHKGGKIRAKTEEHAYIMGIVSLTPRIDYSQGNQWDVNLKNMDEFHKPALDQIGFQELITDQMAWWDTYIGEDTLPVFKSAGKQPAWINYQTDINQIKGNFAIEQEQMFMVLNRRYQQKTEINGRKSIQDLTTYIDPSKYNHIFAYTRRDAQNFWVQIRTEVTARRKMSAKVIPNL